MSVGSPRRYLVWLIVLLILGVLMGKPGTYSFAENMTEGGSDVLLSAEAILKDMTLEEKIGQMFMLDFRRIGDQDVTFVSEDIADTIKKYRPGGVILFKENIIEAQQTSKLTSDYQKSSPKIPMFIAADQEGGAVTRLPYGTVMPGNMALGATGDPKLAYTVAKATGEELQALGINMNFAPVVDVNNNPANPVIGIRSFGNKPKMVARFGVEFMKGLHDVGIIAVAKHFPGHGDTSSDSHIDLPIVPYNLGRLKKVELLPFSTMIRNGVDVIMTAHITFPAIDNRKGIPATLSYKCLTVLLRERMGFEGVIITDAFSMKAITDRYGDKEAASMAIKAGADIVLMPQNIAGTLNYIVEQVKCGEISKEQIDNSVKRILTLKIKSGIINYDHSGDISQKTQPSLETIGGSEHALIQRAVAERAVTLIRNKESNLPFQLTDNCSIVFFTPSLIGADRVKEDLQTLIDQTGIETITIRGFNYDGQKSLTLEEKDAVVKSDFVLLFTRTIKPADLSPKSGFMPDFAADLLKAAHLQGKKLAAIAIRNPYDIQFLKGVKSYLAVYSDWDGGGVSAALEAIFGKLNPVGKLPVSIPARSGRTIYRNGHGLSYPMESGIE